MLLGSSPASAQATPDSTPDRDGWNAPRALELVDRARLVRTRSFIDSTLWSYRADARGFVYFFLDRPGSDERTLVKTDQIALEVYWRTPDQTHQRIVGLRDEKVLPTNIRYHLDHLTVVQDEFPNRIRLGDGDEVSDVTHPVAPGAERVYDYRLADSLTIALPGSEDVRVYEVRVRPQRMDAPGFLGSVFLDRATGAIVRMRFTFTPSSYVDPYLDYIRISLDNLLWEGRHWLPYRQEAELRREIPQLDFAAGSVIRGRFEIGPYVFNEPVPPEMLRRGRVSAVPPERRQEFPFEEELYAQLEEEGLATPVSIDDVRRRAREMVADRYMSGLARLRLHASAASEVYRYRRTEGHVAGIGASYAPSGDWTLKVLGGWAFGRERPLGSLHLTPSDDSGWDLELFGNRPRDMGGVPGASGVIHTLGGLLFDEDWTDPVFVSGGRVGHVAELDRSVLGISTVEWSLGFEHHESAEAVLDDADRYRPVRPSEEGERLWTGGTVQWGDGASPADGWGSTVELFAALDARSDGALRSSGVRAALGWARADTWRDLDLALRLDGGVLADPAPQDLYLLGGRSTLPGHDFRSFVGDRFWLLRAEASRSLADPWIALRLFGAAGQARLDGPLPVGWTGQVDAGVKGSVGAGLGLLWDVLRLDLARGVGSGGDWQFVFSVAPRFRAWL
jgi:hypothetical protein